MSESPQRPAVSYVRIDAGRAGQRLDNFLFTHLKGVPKSLIYRIIRDGQVRVNKGRAKQTTRLAEGDEVRIPPVRTSQETVAPKVGAGLAERLARSLIYKDDQLLVYNKPAGLAVHGGSGISLGLIETLRALRPNDQQLELVHRLDRETSGCVMVARQRAFLRRLQKLMQADGITKRYWLLCRGFAGSERTIDAPLLKMMQGNERVVRVSREGKPSVTHFRVLERFGSVQLVEAVLETGRTHQIRVHAAHGGFPLLGDDKYGDAELNARLRAAGHARMYLHARSLQFDHPGSGKRLTLEAALDEQFELLLMALRENGEAAVDQKAGDL